MDTAFILVTPVTTVTGWLGYAKPRCSHRGFVYVIMTNMTYMHKVLRDSPQGLWPLHDGSLVDVTTRSGDAFGSMSENRAAAIVSTGGVPLAPVINNKNSAQFPFKGLRKGREHLDFTIEFWFVPIDGDMHVMKAPSGGIDWIDGELIYKINFIDEVKEIKYKPLAIANMYVVATYSKGGMSLSVNGMLVSSRMLTGQEFEVESESGGIEIIKAPSNSSTTNLFTNPRFEKAINGTTRGERLRNLFFNPNIASTNHYPFWGGGSGNPVPARTIVDAPYSKSGKAILFSFLDNLNGAGYIGVDLVLNAQPNKVYTTSFKMRNKSSESKGLARIDIVNKSDGLVILKRNQESTVTLNPEEELISCITWKADQEALDGILRAFNSIVDTGPQSWEIYDAITVEGYEPMPFFSGDSPTDSNNNPLGVDFTYQWAGTPNASESIAIGPLPNTELFRNLAVNPKLDTLINVNTYNAANVNSIQDGVLKSTNPGGGYNRLGFNQVLDRPSGNIVYSVEYYWPSGNVSTPLHVRAQNDYTAVVDTDHVVQQDKWTRIAISIPVPSDRPIQTQANHWFAIATTGLDPNDYVLFRNFQITNTSSELDYFDGNTKTGHFDSPDFTTEWLGTPGSSASVVKGLKPLRVGSNSNTASIISLGKGQRLIPLTRATNDTYSYIIATEDIPRGRWLTFLAKLTITDSQSGSLNNYARSIGVYENTGGYRVHSVQSPNEPGEYWHRVFINIPDRGNVVTLRFYNGTTMDLDEGLYWDNVVIVEGIYEGEYFDGDTKDSIWSGVPHDSTSVYTKPAEAILQGVATYNRVIPDTLVSQHYRIGREATPLLQVAPTYGGTPIDISDIHADRVQTENFGPERSWTLGYMQNLVIDTDGALVQTYGDDIYPEGTWTYSYDVSEFESIQGVRLSWESEGDVIVETSVDGDTWVTAENNYLVHGITAGEHLDRVLVRVTLPENANSKVLTMQFVAFRSNRIDIANREVTFTADACPRDPFDPIEYRTDDGLLLKGGEVTISESEQENYFGDKTLELWVYPLDESLHYSVSGVAYENGYPAENYTPKVGRWSCLHIVSPTVFEGVTFGGNVIIGGVSLYPDSLTPEQVLEAYKRYVGKVNIPVQATSSLNISGTEANVLRHDWSIIASG